MLLAVLAAAAFAWLFLRSLTSVRALLTGASAIALGAAMLLTANFALSGKWAWTPGGYGIAFGRMLQDGIVTRFSARALRRCEWQGQGQYRDQLPTNADDFLWSDGVFNKLGPLPGARR